jgi:hypothetical protein
MEGVIIFSMREDEIHEMELRLSVSERIYLLLWQVSIFEKEEGNGLGKL